MTDETTKPADASGCDADPGLGRGGRMSRQRKTAAVLRLLRGEDLELVSRSLGVTAATLSGWRDEFLAGGEAALATKPTEDHRGGAAQGEARGADAAIERRLRFGTSNFTPRPSPRRLHHRVSLPCTGTLPC